MKWWITILLLELTVIHGIAQTKPVASIPEVKRFQFKSLTSKTIPGLISERDLASAFNDAEKIDNVALPICPDKPDGYIFNDGRYNNSNYIVEKGEIRDQLGKIVSIAFRISVPQKRAQEFVANPNVVFIKFPTAEAYSIYKLIEANATKIADIAATDINKNGYTKIAALVPSDFSKPVTLFYLPARNKFSAFASIGSGVEAAQLQKDPFFKVTKYRYAVNSEPYDFTIQYSGTRKFFLNKLSNDRIALIWQTSDQGKIANTTFSADLKSHATAWLDKTPSEGLVAAVTSLNGVSFYVTIDDSGEQPKGTLHRLNPGQKNSIKQALNFAQSDLNIYSYGGGFADLEFSRDTLLFMIARTMHRSPDGLNHQGGIAVEFDANTLKTITNFGQTSGHSFDNLATLDSKGNFIAMDLGDNYPRGVNLHTFKNYKRSKVIYTFKTQHGTTADCWGIATYPEYTEISTKDRKYYRWSNDNSTYTELGSIVDTDDGYLVTFCGEPDEKGLSLNNQLAGTAMPRNVGFVKVAKNFGDRYSYGDTNSDNIILSSGVSESGGSYTFGGKWATQKNEGIVWLTNYRSSDQTAQHLKTIRLQNGNVLLAWELWNSGQYDKTYALIVDSNGKKISDFIELGSSVRLHRRDEPIAVGKKIIFAGSNQTDQTLELIVIEP